jgi:transporter family-2 protein
VLGHPLHATLVNFLVGIAAVFGVALAVGLRTPPPEQWSRTSVWMYLGGVIGAVYVAGVVVLAPRLGAVTLTALVVTGQLGAALLLDHFGWLGFEAHPVSPTRVVGALLLVAGVVLIRRT